MWAPGQAGTTTMVRQSGVGLVEPTGKGMSVWAESAFGPSYAALGPRMAWHCQGQQMWRVARWNLGVG